MYKTAFSSRDKQVLSFSHRAHFFLANFSKVHGFVQDMAGTYDSVGSVNMPGPFDPVGSFDTVEPFEPVGSFNLIWLGH